MSDEKKKPRRRSPRTRDQAHGERVQVAPEGLHRSAHRSRAEAGESELAHWPEGKPEPDVYTIRAPIPCRSCKRVLTPHSSQAVVCDGTAGGGVAYLRCRVCEHRWQLPVRRV